jgi:spore coat protein CotH
VKLYPKAGLYEPTVLRTFFLEFEDKDWEAELADFYHTDVEVPATLIVDGKKYPNVGVRFRGASSFFGVSAGSKRSFNVSLDFVNKKQRLYGYKTLNLLNSHDDPSFLSTVLYSQIARSYIPTPQANFVKVAANGESWGVYVNAQQFNKEFTREFFKGTGPRWKVQGSPGGGGGLEYLGEKADPYKGRFRIKSKDRNRSWKALVELCRILNETPPDKLEKALEPILDIDGVLWFLALDVALINNDGYWVRASDYSLYRDPKGRFHTIPHDMNEAFAPAQGFGFGPGRGPDRGPGGPGAGRRSSGYDLDPLIGLDDLRKPLRSRLLAVPRLKARYLAHVRTIAEDKLDWKKLGADRGRVLPADREGGQGGHAEAVFVRRVRAGGGRSEWGRSAGA